MWLRNERRIGGLGSRSWPPCSESAWSLKFRPVFMARCHFVSVKKKTTGLGVHSSGALLRSSLDGCPSGLLPVELGERWLGEGILSLGIYRPWPGFDPYDWLLNI